MHVPCQLPTLSLAGLDKPVFFCASGLGEVDLSSLLIRSEVRGTIVDNIGIVGAFYRASYFDESSGYFDESSDKRSRPYFRRS